MVSIDSFIIDFNKFKTYFCGSNDNELLKIIWQYVKDNRFVVKRKHIKNILFGEPCDKANAFEVLHILLLFSTISIDSFYYHKEYNCGIRLNDIKTESWRGLVGEEVDKVLKDLKLNKYEFSIEDLMYGDLFSEYGNNDCDTLIFGLLDNTILNNTLNQLDIIKKQWKKQCIHTIKQLGPVNSSILPKDHKHSNYLLNERWVAHKLKLKLHYNPEYITYLFLLLNKRIQKEDWWLLECTDGILEILDTIRYFELWDTFNYYRLNLHNLPSIYPILYPNSYKDRNIKEKNIIKDIEPPKKQYKVNYNTNCYLEELPLELLHYIIQFLDYISIYQLSKTNHYFTNVINMNEIPFPKVSKYSLVTYTYM